MSSAMTFRLNRFDEFIAWPVRFDDETAAALVDAGYVLCPGRFTPQSGAAGVAHTHLAKDGHDPLIGRGAAPAPAALGSGEAS